MPESELIEDAVVVGDQPGVELELHKGGSVTLFGTDDPRQMVEKATVTAEALAGVIKAKNLYKRINNKDFVYVEGWTLLGSMLGVFPVLESCEPVSLDGVEGFVSVVAAQTRDGAIVGRAQAYCMRAETKWRNADTYAVASMSQTRATAKALRQPLGFVMQLAGYTPTPVEEMDETRGVQEARTNAVDSKAERAALMARFEAGLVKLADQPEWQLDTILETASQRWGRRYDAAVDLKNDDLVAIVEAMNKYGKAGV